MNSIYSIKPYKIHPSSPNWVFDDKNTGLVAEAFVGGVEKMIDRALEKFGLDPDNFTCNFSHQPFPSKNMVHLTFKEPDEFGMGSWYEWEDEKLFGWFCPALFKYFPTAPPDMYIEFV